MTAADYFFADEQLSIVTCDEEGAIRMYEYDPQSKRTSVAHLPIMQPSQSTFSFPRLGPESNKGQKLLCQTEFHGQSDYRSSVTIARRMKGEDMVAPQAKLICGEEAHY